MVVNGILELCVRVGEALLSLGADAADVTDAVRRIGRAYGLELQVDLTFTSLVVAYDPGASRPPVTMMRVVEIRSADYGRLAAASTLAYEIVEREGPRLRADSTDEDYTAIRVDLERAHRELDAIISQPVKYRRSLVTVQMAVLAGAVAVLLAVPGSWS